MDIVGLVLCVVSELFEYGRTEDGRPFIGEMFFVQATNARGDTWNHGHVFHGCARHVDEDYYPHFEDLRTEARAKAEQLLEAIKARGSINLMYWNEGRPVYGSDAYVEYGAYEDILWEKENG